jgi:hypothetical protein
MTDHRPTVAPDRLRPHLLRATCPDCGWVSRALADPAQIRHDAQKHEARKFFEQGGGR